MFSKVEETADTSEKKKLLKTISTTPSVDAERRKKAADMVQEIEAKEPPPPPPVIYNPGDPNGAVRNAGTGSTAAGSPSAAPSSTSSEKPNAVPASDVPLGLQEEDAKRRALEPKVWSGKATVDEIRMLKAICGHLGNRGCRDRAAAMLKKKLQEQQP